MNLFAKWFPRNRCAVPDCARKIDDVGYCGNHVTVKPPRSHVPRHPTTRDLRDATKADIVRTLARLPHVRATAAVSECVEELLETIDRVMDDSVCAELDRRGVIVVTEEA